MYGIELLFGFCVESLKFTKFIISAFKKIYYIVITNIFTILYTFEVEIRVIPYFYEQIENVEIMECAMYKNLVL